MIEWLNEENKEISRVMSADWSHTLSRMRWTRVSIDKEKAPPHATSANFGVHLLEDDSSKGSFYIDDLSLTAR